MFVEKTAHWHKIELANPVLAKQLQERGYFILDTHVPDLIAIDRLMPIIVRCNNGRFTCPVQDVSHFIRIIEASKQDWVRDASIAIGH